MNAFRLNSVARVFMAAAETEGTAPAGTGRVLAISREQCDALTGAAITLAQADRTFADSVKAVAEVVARALTAEPTFAQWEDAQGQFIADYMAERDCKEESARKRWVFVCGVMEETYALTKPAKPTKAAEVKAAQREGAAAEAVKLIESAKATTPAAILALSTSKDEPVKPAVVAALAKLAGEAAAKGAKDATDAAKEETKRLREDIRKGSQKLSLVQLRSVAKMVAKLTAENEAAAAVGKASETPAPEGETPAPEGETPAPEGDAPQVPAEQPAEETTTV